MPILYVNPSRGRASGKARVHLRRRARKARRSRNPKRKAMAKSRKRRKGGGKRRARRSTKRRARRAGSKKRRTRRKTGGKRRKARRTRRKSRRKGTGKKRRKARRTRRKSRRRARRSSGRRRRRGSRRRRRSSSPRRRRRRSRTKTLRMGAPHVYGPGGTRVIFKSNPSRRRKRRSSARRGRLARRYRARSYRRNPSIRGIVGMVKDVLKAAAPVMVGFLGSRMVIAKVTPHIPLIDRLPASVQRPVVAILTAAGAHVLTSKVKAIGKYRGGLMTGVGLSVLESLIASFAPPSVKAMIGLSGIYDDALGDYVTVGDYLTVGADPIDDDIALSDYLTVGQVEEELGALGDGLEQELGMGLEEELGAVAGGLNEGVSQGAMLAPVPARQFVGPVPARSFTKQVPHAGAGFDNPNVLYTGIFGGGF